jgi:small subunit ribosomal protein S36
VVAATVAFGALAALWSVVIPLGEGPDEPAHLGLVLHLADQVDYPTPDGLARSTAVVRLCREHAAAVRACPVPGEAVTADAVRRREAADAPPRATRPAWDDDGGRRPTDAANQMPQHPPLAYVAMAGVLRVERAVLGEAPSLDREVALLRLANVLLLAPLPLLAWATARRAGASAPVAELAAVGPLALPMLAATGATVGNDALLVVLGAGVAVLLAGVAAGDARVRTGVAIGAVTGAALLTKAFALVFVPVVAAAYLVGRRRPDQNAPIGAVLRPLAAAAVTVAVVAGPWYAWAWARNGSPVASVDADRYTEALRPPGFSPDVRAFASRAAGLLQERTWGSFGWYTVRLPGWLTVALTAAAVVLVAIGLVVAGRRGRRARETGTDARGGVPRLDVLVVLLAPVVLLAGLVVGRAWTLHARSGQYPFLQGRYLFAGIVGPLVAGSVGLHRLFPRRRRPLLAGIAMAAAFQAYALHRAVQTWWGAADASLAERLDAVVAWGGLPPPVAVLVAVGAACAVVLLGVVALTVGVPSSRGTPPVGSDTR